MEALGLFSPSKIVNMMRRLYNFRPKGAPPADHHLAAHMGHEQPRLYFASQAANLIGCSAAKIKLTTLSHHTVETNPLIHALKDMYTLVYGPLILDQPGADPTGRYAADVFHLVWDDIMEMVVELPAIMHLLPTSYIPTAPPAQATSSSSPSMPIPSPSSTLAAQPSYANALGPTPAESVGIQPSKRVRAPAMNSLTWGTSLSPGAISFNPSTTTLREDDTPRLRLGDRPPNAKVYVKGIKFMPHHATQSTLPRGLLHVYLKATGFKEECIAQAADIYLMRTKTIGIRFATVDLAQEFMDGKHRFLRGLPISAYYANPSQPGSNASRQEEAEAELASLVEAYEASMASTANTTDPTDSFWGNGGSRSPPHHGPSPMKKKVNRGSAPSSATPMEEDTPPPPTDPTPTEQPTPSATAMDGVTVAGVLDMPPYTPMTIVPSQQTPVKLGQDEMEE